MLSYRHAYHAGNPADVLKHCCLMILIQALQAKDKGFVYFDSHAGAGRYDLFAAAAQKNAEHRHGVAHILHWAHHSGSTIRTAASPALLDYAEFIQRCQTEPAAAASAPGTAQSLATLQFYPGSPQIAHALLRAQDQLWLNELQAQEFQQLGQLFRSDPRVALHRRDAYEALPALLPPKLRRGLILVDPSYELKNEGQLVQQALLSAVKKFPTGVYAIWYPLIDGQNPIARLKQQPALADIDMLDVRYPFPPSIRLGRMDACGILILNPPWSARPALEQLCPTLDQVYSASPRL